MRLSAYLKIFILLLLLQFLCTCGQAPPELIGIKKLSATDSLISAASHKFLPVYSDFVGNEVKSSFYGRVLYYYNRSNYLFRIILFLNFFFLISVLVLSMVLLYRRLHDGYIEFVRNKCRIRYRDFITEWLYEDHEGIVPGLLIKELKNRIHRDVFTSNLLSLHSNLTGESAEKLVKLFHLTRLKNYSVQKVNHSLWHIKATGFRELAQMKIEEGNSLIYKYLDSDNEILKIEAQSAWIQLNPNDPLSFYNESNAQFTEWGKLNLLRSLRKGATIPNFGRWLKSDSKSVTLFALRMTGIFKQLDNVEMVVQRLDDSDPEIRYEAICTLGKLALQSPVSKLQQMLSNEGVANKIEVVRSLILISDISNVLFFEKMLKSETNVQLRILVAKGLVLLNEFGLERLDSIFLGADPVLKKIIIHAKDDRI